MSLYLYYYDDLTDQYTEVSKSGTMSQPVTLVHNPDEASSIVQQVFLRNDDPTKYYTNTVVSFKPESAIADGNLQGWTWKILQQDTEPSTATWATATTSVQITDTGSTVDGNIGTATTAYTQYISLWVRGSFVSGMPAGNYDNVYIDVSYDAEGNVSVGEDETV